MADKQVGIRLKASASGLEQIDATGKALGEAGAQAGVLGTKHAQAATQTDALQGQLKGLAGQLSQVAQAAQLLIGGSLLGGAIGEIGKTADAYSNLGARIKLVTGDGANFATAFQGVFDVATRTNSSLEATGELFTRIARAGAALGVSQADALRLTETINQSVQLSGASAEASNAAITQLIQGLQSGALRGDEFNSVMEQSPRLAQALADGLGVTTGELRKLAEAGQLTAATVISSLQGQSAAIQTEFESLPPTIGRSLQNLNTEWTRYVGEVDGATGASHLAAEAIAALARHVDDIGAFLFSAGKAAAAYQAVNLAKTFLDNAAAASASAAAKAADTGAVLGNTAATGANTLAKAANTAETAAAGVAAGRFAAILSSIKLVSLIGIVTNFREIGTAIGEAAAKAMGWGKVLEENELKQRADAQAARDAANARAELAQKTAAAAEKALGLNAASRLIVSSFQDLVTKGDSAADAIAKVAKNLDLGTPKGIQDAVTALDVLAKKGSITAEQLKASLAGALDGKDLGIFEATAIASFDKSAQGAGRLKLVLDAIGAESLKRAGTSVMELETGFSTAMNSAINDTDALAKTLDALGVKGERAGALLATSINKEIDAAKTDAALQLVIGRIEDMGKLGKLAGDDLVLALDKARNKADDVAKGINSVDEALRAFGLKTKAELAVQAATYAAAWDQLKNSTALSLEQQIAAFQKYREAAIAANNGVLPSGLLVQQQILQTRADAAGLGEQFAKAMGAAGYAVDNVGDRLRTLRSGVQQTAGSLAALASASASVLAASGSAGRNADGSTAGGTITTPPPDLSGDYEWVAALGQDNGGHWQLSRAGLARRGAAYQANRAAQQTARDNYSGTTPDGRYEITINIGGALNHVFADSRSAAEKLVADLQAAFKAQGG